MITQGVLPFRYEAEPTTTGMTALAGLPLYLELGTVCGLVDSIRRHMQVCAGKTQGWNDEQIVMSLVLLNLAGGDCVDDLRMLEGDEGFTRERRRAMPSSSAVFRYLSSFNNLAGEERRVVGRALIPSKNEHLGDFTLVNRDILRFAQQKALQREATLDQDATLIETHKARALHSYQGYRAYQPLTTYWAEQDMVVHSEFRDGNVPAGFENLRALKEALEALPEGIAKVYYRSDTAAYQRGLLRYCAEGENERFGVIEFTVGVDVTPEFKRAVAEVKEWVPLEPVVDGKQVRTEQEWAEVCFVPNWVAHSRKSPEYRFLAIREPLGQRELPGMEGTQLPFPTLDMGEVRYKLSGVVTNRDLPGNEVIRWHRARCGKGEEMHAVMKNDLAGGQLPSGQFGANAAWWAIMVLAYNLNSLMKRLAMPGGWASKRLKAVRFGFINLAGRVVAHARQLMIRVSADHPSYDLLLEVRGRLSVLGAEGKFQASAIRSP